jgi:hypothetical protein
VHKDSGHDISLPDLRRICGQRGSRNKMDELKMMNKKRLLVKINGIFNQGGIN